MSNFYLGRIFDLASGDTTTQPLTYNSDDLTTHGVIVGMTGSGKTGLCLDLMEEAALGRIPALMIDPKGDITNALLHFPDLLPDDFAPWINPSDAQRAGKTVDQVAGETADLWRNGLAQWDVTPERIRELQQSVSFSIYTPGSKAGLPISILSTLSAPEGDWEPNQEAWRETISGTVTALLGLTGRANIDPVRDREHILLANIFENAWKQGKDLTLGDLIMQVQNPPFEKLGFFDIGTFYPDKDRFDLALELNNILAAPSFQNWIEGEPLDIQALFYRPDGTPRHTIFYIAHLNEAERMFFVTLLYGAVETWMRQQSGTGSLRALVYFDEIFGYLPPSKNPPSKEPMLRLLKQARAFGLGMVLATQNPVDIDYKALSNAGTWFIGRLATERDKDRLLDGLESAAGGGLPRAEYDRMISGMGKRVFLLRNVHEKEPVLFQTRWAMNYLAGPIMRDRISELNQLAGADKADGDVVAHSVSSASSTAAVAETTSTMTSSAPAVNVLPGTETRPKVPGRVEEYFLPETIRPDDALQSAQRLSGDATVVGTVYYPVLLAQADIRINNQKYGIDQNLFRSCVIEGVDGRGRVRWEDYQVQPHIDYRDLDTDPVPDGRFGELATPLNDSKMFTTMKRNFTEWIYRDTEVGIQAHEELGVFASPDMPSHEFDALIEKAAQAQIAAEQDKLNTKFEKTRTSLETKLEKEKRELRMDEQQLSDRKRSEMLKHGETVLGMLGMFGGRRRSLSGSMDKRRMTNKAAMDVEESEADIARMERELRDLEANKAAELAQLESDWQAKATQTTTISVQPFKKDIQIDLFGVAWMPYFVVEDGGRQVELPAYILNLG